MSFLGAIGSIVTNFIKALDIKKSMTLTIIYFVIALLMPACVDTTITARFPDIGYHAAYYLFLLPISFFLMLFVFFVCKCMGRVSSWFKEVRNRQTVVNELSSIEKHFLGRFFIPNYTDVIDTSISDPIATLLINKGVLDILSGHKRFGPLAFVQVKISKKYRSRIELAFYEQNPDYKGYPDC